MTWSEIVGIVKRLDSYLSEAVYLHGCHLIGQEKTASHDREKEARDHSGERPNADGVQARGVTPGDSPGSAVSVHKAHLMG